MINQALLEFRYKNWPEARALFRRAHEISPSARTLRGLGIVSYEMRDYVEASRALGAALLETRQPLTPEQRREVSDLLTRARGFVGRFSLKISPPDALVEIDGVPAELEPDGSLILAFGGHRIEASRIGYTTESTDLSVQGGERGEVMLSLTKGAAAEGEPQTASIAAPPRESDTPALAAPPEGPRKLRYTWAVLSAGVVFGGGTVAVWLVGQNKLDDLDKSCRERAVGADPCVRGAVSTDAVERLQTLSNVGLVLTSATLLATAVVAYFEWPRERHTLKVGLGPGALSLRGAF